MIDHYTPWYTLPVPDDFTVSFGADGDGVIHLRTTAIAVDEGDTDLAAIFKGTANHPAIAANTIIIGNITSDSDILLVVNDGGNSRGLLKLDADVARILISTGVSSPVPDTLVHIWESSAGDATAIANTLLTLEKSATAYISFLAPTSAGLIFGDVGDDDAGRLIYTHIDDSWEFWSGGSQILDIISGTTAYQQATIISTTAGDLTLNAFNTLVVNSADFAGTPAVTGSIVEVQSQTFTDNVTAGSGTVAAHAFNAFAAPVFDSLNGGAGTEVTVTDAPTVYIAGPPTAVINKTIITNPWALWVDDGDVRFDGNIVMATNASEISTASASVYRLRVGTTNVLTMGGGGGGDNIIVMASNLTWRGSGATTWQNTAGAPQFEISYTANAVNRMQIAGGVTNAATVLSAQGETNVDILLQPKGTGVLQLLGGSALKSSSATEIGIQVTNGALTVGSAGSIQAPYLEQTGALFTDAIGGNLNGCFGFNDDTDAGPIYTLEARMNGAWVSVALTGFLMQRSLDYIPNPDIWVHPNQIVDGRMDEGRCIVCGEEMQVRDAIMGYADVRQENGTLHGKYGHLHLERDPEFATLKAQIWAQGEEIKDLKKQLAAA